MLLPSRTKPLVQNPSYVSKPNDQPQHARGKIVELWGSGKGIKVRVRGSEMEDKGQL